MKDAFTAARDKAVDWFSEHGLGIVKPTANDVSHVLSMVKRLGERATT